MLFLQTASYRSGKATIAAIGAVASMLPGLAAAAEPPCLTASEFTALATYSLPSVITGTAQRCDATLPPDAFLKTDGAGLAARYGDAKEAAWPGAKAAFLKLAGQNDAGAGNIVKGLSDPAMQQIVDTAIAAKVADALPVDRCDTVNQLLKLLAPLPPESTAGVIALAVGLGTKSGRKLGPIAVCPA